MICITCNKPILKPSSFKILFGGVAIDESPLHCSQECRLRIKVVKDCYCVVCGNEFSTTNKKKYCSGKCNPHIKIWDKSPRKCANCKIDFTPKFNKQRHCKRSCNKYKQHSDNDFYQTREWKSARAAFRVLNQNCAECSKIGLTVTMYAVDHIVPIKDGGDKTCFSNLQSLCLKHHQSKSAQEKNGRLANKTREIYFANAARAL